MMLKLNGGSSIQLNDINLKKRKSIVIINYGMGNLRSVGNAISMLGYSPLISDRKDVIASCDAYVLPGVGAFGEAVRNLNNLGLIDVLNEQVIFNRKPFLGICLGLQLLAKDSDEMGFHTGLGWIDGHVTRISSHVKVPHVGWNDVRIKNPVPLFQNINKGTHYYFDHTYRLECNPEFVSATCDYGEDLVAGVQKDNIFATQFHPEKSQVRGLQLLRNYLNYVETTVETN